MRSHFYRHACVLLPKTSNEDRVLIVSQYKNAYIYNIQSGQTTWTGEISKKRGFAQLVKMNSEIFIVGGDFHTEIVEKYDDNTGTFKQMDSKMITGRSRFAHTVATKDSIRSLGVNCKSFVLISQCSYKSSNEFQDFFKQ